MTLETTLAELNEKHGALEIEIEEELARPFLDSLKVSELKREKLRIKEEIEKLTAESEAA